MSDGAVVLAWVALFWPGRADAYIDPGAGNILIQVILGGIAGLLVLGKIYFGRIRDIFRKLLRR